MISKERIEMINEFDNIYVIKSGEYVKVGYSSEMKKRLESYISHNPGIELIRTFYIKDGLVWEKDFHFKRTSLSGNEWYDIKMLDYILELTTNACSIHSGLSTKDKTELFLMKLKNLNLKEDKWINSYDLKEDDIDGYYDECVVVYRNIISLYVNERIFQCLGPNGLKITAEHQGLKTLTYTRAGEEWQIFVIKFADNLTMGFCNHHYCGTERCFLIDEDQYKDIVENLDRVVSYKTFNHNYNLN